MSVRNTLRFRCCRSISYIMFTDPTVSGSGGWILVLYVRPHTSNVQGCYYCINNLGNIDSISPSPTMPYIYSVRNGGVYRCIQFRDQSYYGDDWIDVIDTDIDQIVFSNLIEDEHKRLITDIKTAITEVLL